MRGPLQVAGPGGQLPGLLSTGPRRQVRLIQAALKPGPDISWLAGRWRPCFLFPVGPGTGQRSGLSGNLRVQSNCIDANAAPGHLDCRRDSVALQHIRIPPVARFKIRFELRPQ